MRFCLVLSVASFTARRPFPTRQGLSGSSSGARLLVRIVEASASVNGLTAVIVVTPAAHLMIHSPGCAISEGRKMARRKMASEQTIGSILRNVWTYIHEYHGMVGYQIISRFRRGIQSVSVDVDY